MDLKGMLNTSDNGGPKQQHSSNPPPPGPYPPPTASPSTPGQGKALYRFDYAHPSQASPGKPASHDYPGQRHQSTSYPPQSPYQQAGPYPARQAPPPLQPPSYSDVRSPGGAQIAGPPNYRNVPTTSVPGGGYFPAQPPAEASSPVLQQQYPPPGAYHGRDSYAQQAGAVAAPGPHTAQYVQQSPMPQTPPVGTPGGAHHFLHQRSQSTHSATTPTPTSAHSQQHYGPPSYTQGSPATAHPPLGFPRQQSLPPTPLGPPEARPPSGAPQYGQPPSPYSQRMSSVGPAFPNQPHASPPPPAPPPIPRLPSNHTAHDAHQSETHRRSQSRSERGRSVSVSPKTRISTVPDSSGQQQLQMGAPAPSSERAVTPAKRKMEDRDLEDEPDRREVRSRQTGINGAHIPQRRFTRTSTSPLIQRKRRIRHMYVPDWAQQMMGKRLCQPNYDLVKRKVPTLNGRAGNPIKEEKTSRQASPEATKSQVQDGERDNILGPWEPSILGVRPYEEISKKVADFLFLNVVNNPESYEITSLGIEFEVEAKLGTLIDKDTNSRFFRSIDSECILQDTGRVAFRSSMTEVQHKGLNEFLNGMVIETDPRNPKNASSPRVTVQYKHRREVDKYYELPSALYGRLPGCVRALIPAKHTVKARVTYDQRTGEVLAAIVKCRVADLSLHMPNSPLDCRFSVNLEVAWDGPVEELEQLQPGPPDRMQDRNKDRLSYTQGHYQIDLTQVTLVAPGPGNTQRLDKEHELEIEVSSKTLIDQGQRALSGKPHRYPELVDGLLDNIRVLARKAGEFT